VSRLQVRLSTDRVSIYSKMFVSASNMVGSAFGGDHASFQREQEALLPGVNRPGRKSDHLSPFFAEVINDYPLPHKPSFCPFGTDIFVKYSASK
jgi:hypothetical protein